MATVRKAVLFGSLRWIVRMFSTLLTRMTLTLIVFGDFVPYPGPKRVVPQWAVVTLNTLRRLRPPSLAGRLQICSRWRRHVICCWLAGTCSY